MSRTVMLHGSTNGEVLAMFGEPGHFYRGKWVNVRVTGISKDEDTPLEVRKSLVGLIIPTIFTKERIEEQTGAKFPIPEGSRLAYADNVRGILKAKGKKEEAEQLRKICPDSLDMYVLEKEIYELV